MQNNRPAGDILIHNRLAHALLSGPRSGNQINAAAKITTKSEQNVVIRSDDCE